jgi:acyl-CoA reductase-like NAD-dependent aldehyde dehydrogenase
VRLHEQILVHESIADRVLERILGLIRDGRIGPASVESTQMGPLACRLQLDRVVQDISDALDDGARLLAGGKRPAGRANPFNP